MRAVILEEYHRPLVVDEVEPVALGPHDVRVRTGASGVCHSDLSALRGQYPFVPPIVLGHEGAGTVTEVGSAVDGLRPGDRVIASFVAYCGQCYQCMRGRGQICERSAELGARPRVTRDGVPLIAMTGLGTMAEEMTVNEASLVKVETDLPDEQLALVGCGVTTGTGAALWTARVEPGTSVAVFGCGGVGAAAVAGARLAGAKTIIAVDIDDQKLAWARELGATHTVNSAREDPVEAVRAATGSFGADVTIEAVGRPEVLHQAFYARDLAGTVVQVGVPTPEMALPDISMIDFFGRGGALKPSWYGDCLPSRDFPTLIDHYRQGRLDLDHFVSEVIGLGDVEAAFERMRRGEVLRSVVSLG